MNFNMLGGVLEKTFIQGELVGSSKRYSLRITGGVNMKNSFITIEDSSRLSSIVRSGFQEIDIDNFSTSVPFLNITGPTTIRNVDYFIGALTAFERKNMLGNLESATLTDVLIFDSSFGSNVTVKGGAIDGSHIPSGAVIQGSSIGASELSQGIEVTDSSISSSEFEGDNKVQGSYISGSDIAYGVDILNSEIYNVKIDQNKDDNWCTEDNVDEPEYDENMNPNHCFVSRESEPEM